MTPADVHLVHGEALAVLVDECRRLRQGPDPRTHDASRMVIVIDAPHFALAMLGCVLPAPYLGYAGGTCFVEWQGATVKLGSWEWRLAT